MKNKVNKVIVLGGGAAGWFTAGYLKYKNPELDITLIESKRVGIIGVGESTIPQLGDFFREMGIEERDWMSHTNSLYKLGNKFVGWNIPGKRHHVSNHWWPSKFDEQYFAFAFSLPEKFLTTSFFHQLKTEDYFYNSKGDPGVDDKHIDYWLELARQGRKNWWEMCEDTQEQFYLMEGNKAPFDMDDNILVGPWQAKTYHVDAERFPDVVRDHVAIPNGVKHLWGHVEDIQKDEDGYITKLVLDDGSEHEADLFCDCTGFNRILTGTMDNGWHNYEHIFTRDAIVAPVKYKDVRTEMRPYTQTYAQDEGWNFIITLYNRMGSGYVFDRTEISPEDAKKKFMEYWDGYEFIKEPRHISWDSGRMETPWNKNVVGIGMAGGFVDPMEANSLYVAQACIQLTNRIIERAKDREEPIRKSEIYAFNRNIGNLEDNIADFIAWHYTLTDREDTPFWKKNKELGIKENHKEKCWEAYRKKENYIGGSVYPDYMWAMLCVSMGKLDDEVELNTRPELLEKASVMFEANRKMAEQNGKYAPHIYDWSQKFLFDGKTHEEVLEEALARVSRNKY